MRRTAIGKDEGGRMKYECARTRPARLFFKFILHPSAFILSLLVLLGGCGPTRWTDTKRTATEQMLISDAIDRAVSRIDFRILSGKDVYLGTAYLGEAGGKEYLTGPLRQPR